MRSLVCNDGYRFRPPKVKIEPSYELYVILTEFFGQNFSFMVNSITGAKTFWWLGIESEVVAAAALVVYFRAKRWFCQGRPQPRPSVIFHGPPVQMRVPIVFRDKSKGLDQSNYAELGTIAHDHDDICIRQIGREIAIRGVGQRAPRLDSVNMSKFGLADMMKHGPPPIWRRGGSRRLRPLFLIPTLHV